GDVRTAGCVAASSHVSSSLALRSCTSEIRSIDEVFVWNVRSIVTWSTIPPWVVDVKGAAEQPVSLVVLHSSGDTSGANVVPPSRDCSSVYGPPPPVPRHTTVAGSPLM